MSKREDVSYRRLRVKGGQIKIGEQREMRWERKVGQLLKKYILIISNLLGTNSVSGAVVVP